jgi:hypothetical protein
MEFDNRYPSKASTWRRHLVTLNTARNALAHDNDERLAAIEASGWRLTLPYIRRWRNALDGLAKGMDYVVGRHMHAMLNVRPW